MKTDLLREDQLDANFRTAIYNSWVSIDTYLSVSLLGKKYDASYTIPLTHRYLFIGKSFQILHDYMYSYLFPIGQWTSGNEVEISTQIIYTGHYEMDINQDVPHIVPESPKLLYATAGSDHIESMCDINATFTTNGITYLKCSQQIDTRRTYKSFVAYSLDTDISKYNTGILEIDTSKRYIMITDNGKTMSVASLPVKDMTSGRTMKAEVLEKFDVPDNDLFVFKVTTSGSVSIIKSDWGNASASSSYCALFSSKSKLMIDNNQFNYEQVQSAIKSRTPLTAGTSTYYVAQTAYVAYDTKDMITDGNKAYIASYITLDNFKYDNQPINIISSFSGDADPSTKYVTLRLIANTTLCKALDKIKLSFTGAELMLVEYNYYIKDDDNYYFNYHSDIRLVAQNNGKSFTISASCVSEDRDVVAECVYNNTTPTPVAGIIITHKMFYIICAVVSCVIVIFFVVIMCQCRKIRKRHDMSSASSLSV